jgi:hypothetical protein
MRAAWNEALFREAEAFPSKSGHDDIIDAISVAFLELGVRPMHMGRDVVSSVRVTKPWEAAAPKGLAAQPQSPNIVRMRRPWE